MIRALTTAATGIEAQQANIERIANDLTNANTDGYKRGTTEFADLMYQTIKEPGAQMGAGTRSPVGIQKGMGVKVNAQHKIFEQGPARMTYRPFDFMIEGNGFFPIQLPNGDAAYTRVGSFHLDQEGRLTKTGGARLLPEIIVPQNSVDIRVTNQGEVIAIMQNQEEVQLGQIQVVNFQNVEGLSASAAGVFQATPGSGPPVQGIPGENGLGVIQQGALEGSNVNVANSMVDMITTQRGYEMNTKVMSAADQMLSATVNIK